MTGKEFLNANGFGPGSNLTCNGVAELLDEFAAIKLKEQQTKMECVKCSTFLKREGNKLFCEKCNISAPAD